MRQASAPLGVDLKMGKKTERSPKGPFGPSGGWVRAIRPVLELVTVDVCLVVGQTDTNR